MIDYHPIQEGRENVASKNELPVQEYHSTHVIDIEKKD